MNIGFEEKVLTLLTSIQSQITTLQDKVSTVEISMDTRMSELEISIDTRMSELETSMNARMSELEASMNARMSELEASMNARMTKLENITLEIEYKFDDKTSVLFDAFKILDQKIDDSKKTFSYFESILANHSLRLDLLENSSAS